jgi:hypothetical protein
VNIITALQTIASLTTVLRELAQTASSANGAQLNQTLTALQQIGENVSSVVGMVTQAMRENRDELTDSERDEIRRLNDRAREAQVAAINAASDESGEPAAREPRTQKTPQGRENRGAGQQGGDAFEHARRGAETRKDR